MQIFAVCWVMSILSMLIIGDQYATKKYTTMVFIVLWVSIILFTIASFALMVNLAVRVWGVLS